MVHLIANKIATIEHKHDLVLDQDQHCKYKSTRSFRLEDTLHKRLIIIYY